MTTTPAIADRLTAWAAEVLPELQGTYDYPTGSRDQGLPDVACEVVNRGIQTTAEGGLRRLQQPQQTRVRVWTVELILVVSPDPATTATDQLYDFTDRLENALLDDRTLGGRVAFCDPNVTSSFRPPFVEFDDGTRGRIATVRLNVGELVQEG